MANTDKKKKLSYLYPDSINKISETFNNLSMYDKDANRSDIVDKIGIVWRIEKSKLLKSSEDGVVAEFEKKLLSSLSKSKDKKWVEIVNGAIDPYRRQADVGLSKAKRDIVNFWDNLSNLSVQEADLPWMRHLNLGEKFVSFFEKNKRYIFTGFTNQAILGIALDEKQRSFDSIVITKNELEKLLSHDFSVNYEIPTPIFTQRQNHISQKLGGERSLTSIFVPNKISTWVNKNGDVFDRGNGSTYNPTSLEIKVYDLTEKTRIKYSSQPVWSASSVSHLLTPNVQSALENLKERRQEDQKVLDLSDVSKLADAVNMSIRHQIKNLSLNVLQRGNKAVYWPLEDKVSIPSEKFFTNPVSRYASWIVSVSSSNRHLLERSPFTNNGEIDQAKEILINESVSLLMVKDLEERLESIYPKEFKDNWAKDFEDYYAKYEDNFLTRNLLSSKDIVDSVYAVDNPQAVFNELMSNVLNSLQITKNCKLQGEVITANLRHRKKNSNFERLDMSDIDHERTDLSQPRLTEDPYKMVVDQAEALRTTVTELSKNDLDKELVGSEMRLAYNQICLACEDLEGHVHDRILTMMAYRYKSFDTNVPFELDYNYFTKTALNEMYTKLAEVLDSSKENGKISKLLKFKSEGKALLPIVETYKGESPEILLSYSIAKNNYEENDIAELRTQASYSEGSKLAEEIAVREKALISVKALLSNTEKAIESVNKYLEKGLQAKSNESDVSL